jgi:endonuclease/exonuclease/phosphatase family metal-dependent hydrolase
MKIGDLNAKVGADNTNRELTMGRHGSREQNENGELCTEFWVSNDLVLGGTIFPHKINPQKLLEFSDGKTENQIDHITIGRKWRRSLLSVRVKQGADAVSDHYLVAVFKTKLKAYNNKAERTLHL